MDLLRARPLNERILSLPELPQAPHRFEAAIGGSLIAVVIMADRTAEVIEELAVLAVPWGIAQGSAGSLEPGLTQCTQIAASAALVNDGVSRVYARGDLVEADPDLLACFGQVAADRGVEPRGVRVATVEALYREHEDLVAAWRDAGANAINMETSPLYAAASALDLAALWIAQVSDELRPDGRWTSWNDHRERRERARSVSNEILVAMVYDLIARNGRK
ncbi:MAG: hypothetical protein P8Y13_08965 [Deinococcales bacterium]